MALKIYFENKPRLVENNDPLFEKYRLMTAAGGLVVNDEGHILMIFRRQKWDLPKGKLEEGESIEECAEREVKEETGLNDLQIQDRLITSYHTYKDKKQYFLKETHWFLFAAPGVQSLQPQTEEDITKIEWADPVRLANYCDNTYGLIKDVLQSGGFEC